MPLYTKILVPIDGSSTANKALDHALALAADAHARVRLLHALDELAYVSAYEYSGELMRLARENADKLLQAGVVAARARNVEVDTRRVDSPGQRLGETVADEAAHWGADLVVVGTQGYTRLQASRDQSPVQRSSCACSARQSRCSHPSQQPTSVQASAPTAE